MIKTDNKANQSKKSTAQTKQRFKSLKEKVQKNATLPHWQKDQQKKQKASRLKKISWAFLLILLAIGAFFASKVIWGLFTELPAIHSETPKITWDGQSYQNYLVVVVDSQNNPQTIQQILTITADPSDQSLNFALFQNSNSAYSIANADLEQSIYAWSGKINIYVDGYLVMDKSAVSALSQSQNKQLQDDAAQNMSQMLHKIKSPLSFIQLYKTKNIFKQQGVTTNLSTRTLLRLFLLARNVRQDHQSVAYHQVDFENFINPLPDYWFVDSSIRQERLKISVLNATSFPLIAHTVAMQLSKMGAEIILTDNTQATQEKTQVLVIHSGGQKTVERLEKIFKTKAQKNPNPEDRADITIIIGNDYLSQ